MSKARHRLLSAILLSMLGAILAVGCGSSATTSRSEVVAVAAAEQKFAAVLRQANMAAKEECRSRSNHVRIHCFQKAFEAGEEKAASDFSDAIERLLAGGVGSGCAAALEEALGSVSSVPLFPGDAAAACRAESGARG